MPTAWFLEDLFFGFVVREGLRVGVVMDIGNFGDGRCFFVLIVKICIQRIVQYSSDAIPDFSVKLQTHM